MWSGRILLILLPVAIVLACSPRQFGINRMAAALSSTADAYAKDDDPEFVRLAAPSTLKTVEMLLEQQPANAGLLMTACSGFTQYAYAFLHIDAEQIAPLNPEGARDLRSRARRMYERARGYCLRELERRHPGVRTSLSTDAISAVVAMTKEDVPALYWTGVSTAGSVSVSENQVLRVNDLATARALLTRALALDETWEAGAIHEAFITLEGQPRLLGGSPARAKEHFVRAVELSRGQSAFAYVSMASSVALPAKDRTEFERLLRTALAIDVDKAPRLRLANAIAQKHARFLLSRVEQLF
jgi:predicted anti-sigma-YlaC factor YlaD